ncbi:MAG: HlyC/CorC family transporter [Clostridia bacterium]|nr:HlyC/CorC family transporter [Clostridia bacterium]
MFKQLLLQFILILLNAFFAATEIALISLNEKKVQAMAEDGDKKAKKMLKIIEDPTKFLSAIQVGITLAGFLGSAFAADNFAEVLSGFIVKTFGVGEAHIGVINSLSVVLITLILSYFTLILGELVPKRIAMKHKEKLAGAVCGIMSFLTALLRPVIWFLTVSTNAVLRLFRINPNEKEEAVSEEDIVIMLDAGAEEGTLKQDDVEYIKNVFRLEHLTAADVMTPRSSLIAVSTLLPQEEVFRLIEEEGYSRMPVYEADIDKIVGVLHTREYLMKCNRPGFKLEDALMPPDFVPETMRLDKILKDMQTSHNHMMVVVNEYGMTLGVVTMEDIIEELVGEIWDEQDEAHEEENIKTVSETEYTALSATPIDEFFEFFSLEPDETIESTTVNGWLTECCGGIPEEGYNLIYNGLSITVTDADEQITREVRVEVLPVAEETDEDTVEERN